MYATLDSYNMTQGIQILACYVNDVTIGMFGMMLLFSTFLIIVVGSYFMQKKASGVGDIIACFAMGSFTTLIFAVLLKLVTCPYNDLVNNTEIGVLICLFIISLLLLFKGD